jgi:hypothetical protein
VIFGIDGTLVDSTDSDGMLYKAAILTVLDDVRRSDASQIRIGGPRADEQKAARRPLMRCSRGPLFAGFVLGIGRQHDQAAVDRERSDFDAEARSFFVREGGADLGPVLRILAVAFKLLHREDVELGDRRCGGLGLIELLA